MAPAGSVTVVLADDDEDVRGALRELFEGTPDIEVVAEAGSADEAVAACEEHVPDVALLDVRMPGGGLEAAHEITAGSATKVLVLTAHDTPEARALAAENGAARFVVKSGGEDLVHAVRDVAGR